ncbi:MAG: hypothetical protein V3U87_15400 [Methylococcaceae bacterium]
MIGGSICKEQVGADMLNAPNQELDNYVKDILWLLFVSIGETWMNSSDIDSYKERWKEFIQWRISTEPNYSGEYINAHMVINELFELYGQKEAFSILLLDNDISIQDNETRLVHMKKYVVDEFIKVCLTSGGFKNFGARNYNSFVGGVRNSNPSPYRGIGE